jgi:hypothetical protein
LAGAWPDFAGEPEVLWAQADPAFSRTTAVAKINRTGSKRSFLVIILEIPFLEPGQRAKIFTLEGPKGGAGSR